MLGKIHFIKPPVGYDREVPLTALWQRLTPPSTLTTVSHGSSQSHLEDIIIPCLGSDATLGDNDDNTNWLENWQSVVRDELDTGAL